METIYRIIGFIIIWAISILGVILILIAISNIIADILALLN